MEGILDKRFSKERRVMSICWWFHELLVSKLALAALATPGVAGILVMLDMMSIPR